MTRDNSSSDKTRVIIDLSWPKGQSVNSSIDSDRYLNVDFVLTYRSIDNITDEVLRLGRGCQIFKVDISRAFRHFSIDPGDLDLLGLHWSDYYINRCCLDSNMDLPFFNVCPTHEGHKISKYIHNFLCVSLPSKINHSYSGLQSLLEELGLMVSTKKLVPSSTQVVCLCILVDTETFTVSIPPVKTTGY